MDSQIEYCRAKLLKAGVSARYVSRYIEELQDHWVDLAAAEEGSGQTRGQACATASARLGSLEALTEAAISRHPPRAWSARAPKLFFLLLPPISLAASTFLSVLVLAIAQELTDPSAFGLAHWFKPWMGELFILTLNLLLPSFITGTFTTIAVRQQFGIRWPLATLAAMTGMTVLLHPVLGYNSAHQLGSFGIGMHLPTATIEIHSALLKGLFLLVVSLPWLMPFYRNRTTAGGTR